MPADAEPPFEADLAELDRVLKDLEDGSTSLDASLARYEQGVLLLRRCYSRLRAAEQKIHQLTGLDEASRLQLTGRCSRCRRLSTPSFLFPDGACLRR